MDWEHLAFLHWPLAPRALDGLLPPELELETHDGDAFLGVVPFLMTNVRHRLAPTVPGTGVFPELNVRTYVTAGGKPGVWFFSLDATSRLAVRMARHFFALPYFDARMSIEEAGGEVRYRHERTHRGAWPASFTARYRPTGEPLPAAPGSLEYFLTERYCLYAARGGRLLRADVAHQPWPLQSGEVELERCSMADSLHLPRLGAPPLVHVARRVETVAWWLRPVDTP